MVPNMVWWTTISFVNYQQKLNEGEDTRIFQKKIPQENTIGYEVDLENTEKKITTSTQNA